MQPHPSSIAIRGHAVETAGDTTGRHAASRPKRGLRLTPAIWNASVMLIPVIAIVIVGWKRRWISDDGLIFVRTVRQILAGNGPVVNIGERAEASTSTLWQWLLALLGTASNDVTSVAVIAGLVLTGAGVGLALDAARRLYRDLVPAYPYLMPAGVLVMLALPPVWDFATSGLETGLSTLWIASCWWLLVWVRPEAPRWALVGVSVTYGLGPLVRPDLAIVTVVFGVALWLVVRPGWRQSLGLAAAAAAFPVAYEIFRMGYYGRIVPLPAIAKEASASFWHRGLTYLDDLIGPYRLWVPLVALAVLVGYGWGRAGWDQLNARMLAVVGAPVVAAGLSVTYVLRVGGDFMHGRLLLPALLLVMLPVFAIPLTRGVAPLVAVIVAWSLVCATDFRVPYRDNIGPAGVADERGQWSRALEDRHPVDAPPYIRHLYVRVPQLRDALASGERQLLDPRNDTATPLAPTVPGGTAAAWPILGSLGAALELDDHALDPYGLSYPLAAHLELSARLRPGHEKELSPAWVIADYGDPAALPPRGVDPEQVRAARHALTCGELRELVESARAPLTWNRFWKNVVGAPRRTALRVPSEPLAAERRFCGGR